MPIDPLAALLRCRLCGTRFAGPGGCCRRCLDGLFAPVELPGLLALGAYRGRLAAAVRAFKFAGVRRLAAPLAAALASAVRASGWRPQAVTHVPLHPSRLRRRGFNQSALLAAGVARRLGVPHLTLLERTRPTRQQARLGLDERRRNVSRAFACGSARPPPLVLLVDDVLTSGATADACRHALLACGARQVLVAVVALAIPGAGQRSEPATAAVVLAPSPPGDPKGGLRRR